MRFFGIALFMFIMTSAVFCCVIGYLLHQEGSKFGKRWLFVSIANSLTSVVLTHFYSNSLFPVHHAVLLFICICDIILFYVIMLMVNKYLPKCVCKHLQMHLNPEFTIKIAKGEFGVCPRCRKGVIRDFLGMWVEDDK